MNENLIMEIKPKYNGLVRFMTNPALSGLPGFFVCLVFIIGYVLKIRK